MSLCFSMLRPIDEKQNTAEETACSANFLWMSLCAPAGCKTFGRILWRLKESQQEVKAAIAGVLLMSCESHHCCYIAAQYKKKLDDSLWLFSPVEHPLLCWNLISLFELLPPILKIYILMVLTGNTKAVFVFDGQVGPQQARARYPSKFKPLLTDVITPPQAAAFHLIFQSETSIQLKTSMKKQQQKSEGWWWWFLPLKLILRIAVWKCSWHSVFFMYF